MLKNKIIKILRKYSDFDEDDHKESQEFNSMTGDFEKLINVEVEKRIKERMPSEEDAQNAESRYEDEQNEDKLRFDTEYCFRDYMNGWEDCRSRLTNPHNNLK